MASSSPPSCSSWETFDDVNFNDENDDDARTRRRLRRPSLAAAQPSRNDRNRTTEDNRAAASAINHPISEDVAFARMNKPNDFRLRNLFFQQDVSVYSSVTETVRIRANTFRISFRRCYLRTGSGAQSPRMEEEVRIKRKTQKRKTTTRSDKKKKKILSRGEKQNQENGFQEHP